METKDLEDMAPAERRAPTQEAFLELVENAGRPDPDEIDFTGTSLWFKWNEQKLVVQVDLTDEVPLDPEELLGPPLEAQC